MRFVALIALAVLLVRPRAAAAQCDASGRRTPDPLTRAIAAMHATPADPAHPAVAPQTVHVSRAARPHVARAAVHGAAPSATSSAANRRQRVAVRRPKRRAVAKRPVTTPTTSAVACRNDDEAARRLAGIIEGEPALGEVMSSPFGVESAPAVGMLQAAGTLPSAPALTSVGGLGPGGLGTLAGGIGGAPGISSGIMLGALTTAGIGGAVWKALHHPSTAPPGGTSRGDVPAARPEQPPTAPLTQPGEADGPASTPPAGDPAPTDTATGGADADPSPSPTDVPRVSPPTPPIDGGSPWLPGDPTVPPAIQGQPFPEVPVETPNGGGGTHNGIGPSGDPEPRGDPGATTPVPEPLSGRLVLVGAGILLLATRRRHHR